MKKIEAIIRSESMPVVKEKAQTDENWQHDNFYSVRMEQAARTPLAMERSASRIRSATQS